MYVPVPEAEISFAMALFVSAAEGHTLKLSAFAVRAASEPNAPCRRLFIRLSFGLIDNIDPVRSAALLESGIFRAFVTLWQENAGNPLRDPICARVLGFFYLMERSRAEILGFWKTPEPKQEFAVLHPAIVTAVSTVELTPTGLVTEPAFLSCLNRIADTYPDLRTRPRSELMSLHEPTTNGITWPAGDGEVAQLMRRRNWAASSSGATATWPQSLKTAIDLTIACHFPMVVLWGVDLIQFYNDAYRGLMGSKHPAGLGQPTRDCWPEVWAFNEPFYTKVLAGESTTIEDQLFPIHRYGYLEDAYFTLCYSPLRNESSAVQGVLVTVFETTLRVRSRSHILQAADHSTSDELERVLALAAGKPVVS